MAFRNTQVAGVESGGNGGEVGRLARGRLSGLIDDTYDLGVTIDRTLAADGRAGWLDDARKASLGVLEQLAHLRAALDREAVAAGLLSPYVRRDLRPCTTTGLAAAEAMREQREADLAAQVEREHRSAEHGKSVWATRQTAGTPQKVLGTLDSITEPGDCPGSVHKGAPTWPSAATADAHATPSDSGDHDRI